MIIKKDIWKCQPYLLNYLKCWDVFPDKTHPRLYDSFGKPWHWLYPVHSHSPSGGPTCPRTQCQIPHGWATWPSYYWTACLTGLQELGAGTRQRATVGLISEVLETDRTSNSSLMRMRVNITRGKSDRMTERENTDETNTNEGRTTDQKQHNLPSRYKLIAYGAPKLTKCKSL